MSCKRLQLCHRPSANSANLGACTAPPSLTARAAWRIPPGFTIRGTELEEKKALVSPGEGEWRSKRDTGQFFPPITCYPTHGKRLVQCGDCRILRMCSVSPSPQRLQMSARKALCANTWEEATLRVEWALTPRGHGSPWDRYAKATASTIQWGQPLFGDSLPFCLASVADKELLKASEAPGFGPRICAMLLGDTGNTKAGSASSEGSACRFTTWCRKGVVGTLGTYPGRGSQDNVRVGRPEHKALLAYRNAWRSRPFWWKWARSGVLS